MKAMLPDDADEASPTWKRIRKTVFNGENAPKVYLNARGKFRILLANLELRREIDKEMSVRFSFLTCSIMSRRKELKLKGIFSVFKARCLPRGIKH